MTERFASRECPAPLVLVLVHCQLDGQKAAKSDRLRPGAAIQVATCSS